jgi:D-glycero-D-manno-heptose 1,7-bisphosphate phosphatase
MSKKPEKYNKEWSLFLDRDGVINKEIQGTYVTSWEEFQFYDGSLKAIESLSRIFGKIIVVTNQRGVGRGIMQSADLIEIHENMQSEIAQNGGRIDKIYACTSVNDDDANRKPNTGMAAQAKEDFENIDFKKSVMVGNNLSDMLFGKRVAMHTVFLNTTSDPVELPHDTIDEQYASLKQWADSLNLIEEPMLS